MENGKAAGAAGPLVAWRGLRFSIFHLPSSIFHFLPRAQHPQAANQTMNLERANPHARSTPEQGGFSESGYTQPGLIYALLQSIPFA